MPISSYDAAVGHVEAMRVLAAERRESARSAPDAGTWHRLVNATQRCRKCRAAKPLARFFGWQSNGRLAKSCPTCADCALRARTD